MPEELEQNFREWVTYTIQELRRAHAELALERG
jgi:hypothetical protein